MPKAEEVVIQTSDLELLQNAIENGHWFSLSNDLVEQYRALDARGRTSALTKQLEEALGKVNAALQLAEEPEEEPEDESTE